MKIFTTEVENLMKYCKSAWDKNRMRVFYEQKEHFFDMS